MKPAPLFIESASGARIWDADGNEYIDYLLAYGPLILGHAHPALTDRINRAMKKGYTYGMQHDGEIELAQRLTELLPCADKVAFSGSGTEAVTSIALSACLYRQTKSYPLLWTLPWLVRRDFYCFPQSRKVTDFEAFQLRDAAKYTKFAELMLIEGVLVRPSYGTFRLIMEKERYGKP